MRLKFIYLAMILTAVTVLAACNATDNSGIAKQTPKGTPEVTYPDGVRRITPAELDELIKKDKAFVVDVRFQDSYDLGHIPGARLIPAGEILDHVSELPRDKIIVTYCS